MKEKDIMKYQTISSAEDYKCLECDYPEDICTGNPKICKARYERWLASQTRLMQYNKTLRGMCRRKTVHQINKDTQEVIATYPSVQAAALAVNGVCSNLGRACRTGRCYHGCKWQYAEVSK